MLGGAAGDAMRNISSKDTPRNGGSVHDAMVAIAVPMVPLKAQQTQLQASTLGGDAFDALAGLALREMKKRIHLACGQAALDGRKVVLVSDFPPAAAQARRMGF